MSINNYILTSNGELCHYGVPGMKWGKRKNLKSSSTSSIDKTGRKLYKKYLEGKRRKNDREYKREQIADILKPTTTGGKDSVLQKHQRMKDRSRNQKLEDARLSYKIAKNKVKQDPKYRNSEEYKRIENERNRQETMNTLRKIGNSILRGSGPINPGIPKTTGIKTY